MNYYLLLYDVCDGFAERRSAYRAEHLEQVDGAYERGELLLAGAYGDPPSGAALLFRAQTAAVAERFARNDPYVRSGLVSEWRVEPWHVVVGEGAQR